MTFICAHCYGHLRKADPQPVDVSKDEVFLLPCANCTSDLRDAIAGRDRRIEEMARRLEDKTPWYTQGQPYNP